MKTLVLCHYLGQQRGTLSESLLNAKFLLVPTQSPRYSASLLTSPDSFTTSGNSAACLGQGMAVQLTGQGNNWSSFCFAGQAAQAWGRQDHVLSESTLCPAALLQVSRRGIRTTKGQLAYNILKHLGLAIVNVTS